METLHTLIFVHSLISLSLLIILTTGFFMLPREFSVPSMKILLHHFVAAASLYLSISIWI